MMIKHLYAGSVWNVLSPFASLKVRIAQARRQAERLLADESRLWTLPALKLEGLADELADFMGDWSPTR